jgi:heme A synthase
VIAAAGFWTCVLVIWRIFDKQGTSNAGQVATTSGIEWGIFVALVVAALLAYSGMRIRAAHAPEPPLPGEPGTSRRPPSGAPTEEPDTAPTLRFTPQHDQLTIPFDGDKA